MGIGPGLRGVRGDDFRHGVGTGFKAGESVASIAGGQLIRFAGVELAVVVQVEIDRHARRSGFTRIDLSISIQVTPFCASDFSGGTDVAEVEAFDDFSASQRDDMG